MNAGKTIKEILVERGLTPAQFEKIAGLGNGTITSWETSSPTIKKLSDAAKALEMPLIEVVARIQNDGGQ